MGEKIKFRKNKNQGTNIFIRNREIHYSIFQNLRERESESKNTKTAEKLSAQPTTIGPSCSDQPCQALARPSWPPRSLTRSTSTATGTCPCSRPRILQPPTTSTSASSRVSWGLNPRNQCHEKRSCPSMPRARCLCWTPLSNAWACRPCRSVTYPHARAVRQARCSHLRQLKAPSPWSGQSLDFELWPLLWTASVSLSAIRRTDATRRHTPRYLHHPPSSRTRWACAVCIELCVCVPFVALCVSVRLVFFFLGCHV